MKSIFMFVILVYGVFDALTDEVKSVMEGDSVTLHTNLTELQTDDKIFWWFGPDSSSILLAQIDNGQPLYPDSSDFFKDKLQIDHKTGNLIIMNVRLKHTGEYRLWIDKGKEGKSRRTFKVTIHYAPSVIHPGAGEVKSMSVRVGDSVTLHTGLTELQRDYLILWRFGDEGVLIAKDDKEDNNSLEYDDVLDKRFSGKLQMNDQTGDLHISHTTTQQSGVYKMKISSNNKQTYKTFNVGVREQALSRQDVAVVSTVVLLVMLLLVYLIILFQNWHKLSQAIAYCKASCCKAALYILLVLVLLVVFLLSLLILINMINQGVLSLTAKCFSVISYVALAVMLVPVVVTGLKYRHKMLQLNQVGLYVAVLRSGIVVLQIVLLGLMMLMSVFVIQHFYKISDENEIRGESIAFCVVLLVATVNGVIYNLHIISKPMVRKMPVFRGDSVFLPTGVTKLQRDHVIELSFKDKVICRFNMNRMYEMISSDERLIKRLKLDEQTGSLIISNMIEDYAGLYKVKISSNSKVKSCIQCISRGPPYSQFNVIVKDSTGIRENSSKIGMQSLLNEEDDV